MADNPEGKDFYLKTAVDVAVDFRSWLAEWVLVDLVKSEDITAASNDLLALPKLLQRAKRKLKPSLPTQRRGCAI